VIEIVLLAGKLLLLALLYLFLFAAMRTGVGMVSGRVRVTSGELVLAVTQGPRELRGTRLPISGPIVIGRSPGADIVIADDFVSARHARITPAPGGALLEDLGSTNGTVLDGARITSPALMRSGSVIELGTVRLEVRQT
jgi:pSer/pThr/pTyr-binding forkhead associated (FHA) protein